VSCFNLALNNIRKKFGSYSIYLISASFAVTVFCIFCSMYFNPQFSKYRFGSGKMAILFQVSAVAVLLFATIFVFYSNKFFIRTRKKEIAVYSLLGMKKSQIGIMLFYENICIGLLATVCGLILGTLSSGIFCRVMFRLMKQVPKVDSGIRLETVLLTVLAFFIIFLLNSINAYTIIYRFKLIELLSANKEGEKLPRFSFIGGIFSLIMIAAGYLYGLSIDFNKGGMKQLPGASLVILMVVAGTLLFFTNFIPMVVVKLQKNKTYYYKITNLISLSQIVYRIKANSRILSIIAIMSAITVTMISATLVLYSVFEKTASTYTPFSYLSYDVDDSQYEEILGAIRELDEVKLLSTDRFTLMNTQGQSDLYATDLTYDTSPGEAPTRVYKAGDSFDAYIMSSSDYKKIIRDLNVGKGECNNQKTDFTIDLKENECFFLDGNMNSNNAFCKALVGEKVHLYVTDVPSDFIIAGVSMHKYLGVFKYIRKTTLVLNDRTYDVLLAGAAGKDKVSYMGLTFDDPMKAKQTVDALNQIVPENTVVQEILHMKNLNYYDMNSILYAQYGAYLFIGTFLGILFLSSIRSIMYYKQIIEAGEEIGRYQILKKTGMKKSEARCSISRQLAVVFGMPLFIGLIHSAFALITYNRIMMFVSEEVSWGTHPGGLHMRYLYLNLHILLQAFCQ